MENKPEIKVKSNKPLIALIVLLVCPCGYLIWENRNLQKGLEKGSQELNEVNAERSEVKGELEEMLLQYQEMEASNEGLSKELAEEKEKIESLLKKVKAKDWSIYKLKKETESLRKIMKGFVVQIDSLNQVNGRLTAENKIVKNKLTSEKDKTKNLTIQNEDLVDLVSVASHLKTMNLKSYGVKVKSNNTGKESDRAKKVGKIRTQFTILRNDITKPGKKWIYLRVLTPDGKVLSEKTDDSNKFDFNGVRGLFSSKKQINYQNKEEEIVIDWIKIEDFPVGEYNIEVYADGVDIGKTKFILR